MGRRLGGPWREQRTRRILRSSVSCALGSVVIWMRGCDVDVDDSTLLFDFCVDTSPEIPHTYICSSAQLSNEHSTL